MKKYRSISIPEKLPSVYKFKRSIQNTSNRSRVYSSLPSQLTQELYHLQQENYDLRSKLKEISAKLSHLIESNRFLDKSRSTPDPRPTLNIEIVKKNLFYYENEFKRLEYRQKLLSDPKYEAELKAQIEELKGNLTQYEDKVKKNEAQQKLREKTLNTVLDTGELGELYDSFNEMNTELSVFNKRYEKMRLLNEKTLQSNKDFVSKIEEYEKEVKKLEKIADITEDGSKFLNEGFGKLQKKFEVVHSGLYSTRKVLAGQIKKLMEELEASQKTEDLLQLKLDKMDQDHIRLAGEMNNILNKNTYEVYSGDKEEDYVYLTQRFN